MDTEPREQAIALIHSAKGHLSVLHSVSSSLRAGHTSPRDASHALDEVAVKLAGLMQDIQNACATCRCHTCPHWGEGGR